jgi:hypothetical protein
MGATNKMLIVDNGIADGESDLYGTYGFTNAVVLTSRGSDGSVITGLLILDTATGFGADGANYVNAPNPSLALVSGGATSALTVYCKASGGWLAVNS